MTTAMDASTIYNSSIKALISASVAFKNSNIPQGFKDFRVVYPTLAHEVYKQLWKNKRESQDNLECGKHAFHDINGLSSTALEKAQAIDDYLLSTQAIDKQQPRIDNRSMTNGHYEWRNNGHYEWQYDITEGRFRLTWITNWDKVEEDVKKLAAIISKLDQKTLTAIFATAGAACLLVAVYDLISALRK